MAVTALGASRVSGAWKSRRSRCRASAFSNRVSVTGPPDDFCFRKLISTNTDEIVAQRWPELIDIVRDGSLVVVKNVSEESTEPEIVILVGTAHVSKISAQQVERVIKAVQPDNVVVELCKSRVGMMYMESTSEETGATNLFSLTDTDRNAALARSFKLGGRSAFFLRLLLAGVSDKISKSASASIGIEFRAARKAAKEVGAQLVLGDRPIEITLNRAWTALGWKERLQLASLLSQTMASKIDASEATLEKMKSDDALSAMYTEMSKRFPSLLQCLVRERDLYLAWSLKRSKAVKGCKTVVGVIGKGHLRGVVYALRNSQEHLRFRDLVGQRDNNETVKGIARGLIVEGLIGFLLWMIYDFVITNSGT